MIRSIQLFKQSGDAVVTQARRKAHLARGHNKSLSRLWLPRSCQPEAQQPVDGSFEGIPRAPHLVLYEFGYIVVDGKSGPHIMMLPNQAS